jgi:hypothetical protein
VIPERLERSTHSLEGCCSIQLSYGTKISNNKPPNFLLYPPDSYRDELRNLFPGAKIHFFSVSATVFLTDCTFSHKVANNYLLAVIEA